MACQIEEYAGWYLVVFVDVLGQTQLLRQMRGLPNKTNQKQMEEFVALLKKTVGTVKRFRDCFTRFFEEVDKQHRDLSDLTTEQRRLYAQSKGNPLKSHMFSDFVALFLSLRDDINKVPMSGVYAALMSAASTFLTMLAGRQAIRGGIDIGVAVELCDKEVYGSALARAYELESKTANYPRIVLGEEIVRYIQFQQVRPDKDVFATMNKRMADLCAKLIAIDDDGVPFLDYLGDGFRQDVGKTLESTVVKKAYDFIIEESARCQTSKNSVLAFRYTLLRNYFEHRMHLWFQPGSQEKDAEVSP